MTMDTLSLFDDLITETPRTEGIKYAGSKTKLLPYILSLVAQARPKTILDAFSGSTRVSQALAQSGYTVIANDVSVWSEVFGSCYLLNDYSSNHYEPFIEHLNNLPPVDGWFTQHYGGDAQTDFSSSQDGLKKPWQRHNTRRLDAIRTEIDKLCISNIERSVLLTSLILALDEVDSTLGHYASYLNEWSPRSYKHLRLKVPKLFPKRAAHTVYRKDVFELAPQVKTDLAYLDPPYGSNNEKMPPSRIRYAAYYHLWTTICLNDKPEVFGKVKRRSDTSDVVAGSVFEDFRRADSGRFVVVEAIEKLLRSIQAEYIILSYSSGGRATAEELNDVISKNGQLLDVIEIDHKRNVMAGMRWTNDWVKDAEAPNREFLFLMKKDF